MKNTIIAALLAFTVLPVLWSAPSAELWDRWTQRDEGSSTTVNHTPLAEFLDVYRVIDSEDGIAKIRYSSVTPGDHSALEEYLEYLQNRDVDGLSENQQFAYWVNLYNSATLLLILDNYPLDSIRNISKPWDQKLLRVAGEEVSLNDIEHRILRPIWDDYRIHFVVNCASLGCPDIPAEPLNADNLDAQLQNATANYLSHPRGMTRRGRALVLSSIFSWYSSDFGDNETEVLATLGTHRDLDPLLNGDDLANLRIRYDYDWNLNAAP